jgi:hypothetical protein
VQAINQTLDGILETLRPLTVEWQDDVARRVIARLRALSAKPVYRESDVEKIIDGGSFDDGMLIARLFLGLSKDAFEGALRTSLGGEGAGKTRYNANREAFLAALSDLGLLEAMAAEATREPHWSDTVVERLRSGRGSAISGQKRGRGVEDFAEGVVSRVFGTQYHSRVTFVGKGTKSAKCDFAIPSRDLPRILIEAKGYGATGSKMTDVIGDIEKIIAAKRSDTAFLFFTDGLTWKQRQADLRKIVKYQNDGDITRIYTYAMAEQFEADLRTLGSEYGL